MRRVVVAALFVLAAAAGAFLWWQSLQGPRGGPVVLYGNVEVRQVDLAFGVEGLIAEVLVDEGDRVATGQVLAVLDQEPFRFAVDSAEAALRSAEQRLAELVAGSRPQEVERAQASLASADAAVENTAATLARTEELVRRQAASQQALDAARMAHRTAIAEQREARADLALSIEGTRAEQIAQQRAELEARRAALALQTWRRERSTLRARSTGIVLTRIREPGAVVLANSPMLTISVIDPVWIRAYVDEPHLGAAVPGRAVTVTTDSAPGRSYAGRIGFVSPTAEFTPKSVETAELRTALVYRVRIIVDNPDQELRQGMPATITLGPLPAPARP